MKKEKQVNAWKYLKPKFQTPVVIKFEKFFDNASFLQKMMLWGGAAISVIILVFLLVGILRLVS